MLLFNVKDSTLAPRLDSIKGVKKVNIIVSKVIHNAYNTHENYLTINSGAAQGIQPDMGVINSAGIIGIIDKTSENYASIISILNVKSQINAKIKKQTTLVRWFGTGKVRDLYNSLMCRAWPLYTKATPL